MVWVKFREVHGGTVYVFWKQFRSMANAKKLVAGWNRFSKSLWILKHQKGKPANLKKSKAPGVYHEK